MNAAGLGRRPGENAHGGDPVKWKGGIASATAVNASPNAFQWQGQILFGDEKRAGDLKVTSSTPV
jgi:hypothetical protein